MIKILHLDGKWCPVLVCDVCGKLIRDVKRAMTAFDMDTPIGEMTQALFVHKQPCLPVVHQYMVPSGYAGTGELTADLCQLISNIGTSLEALKEIDEMYLEFGLG